MSRLAFSERRSRGRLLSRRRKKHGAENTAQLQREAAGSGKAVGQWLDNAAAEDFISKHLGELKNGARTSTSPEDWVA